MFARCASSVSKARTLSRLDRLDLEDFRVRVLRRLGRPLDRVQQARAAALERAGAEQLRTSGGLEPSLQQPAHVEKDKQVLRALLEFAISPNKPKQWLQELFDSLQVGSTPADCFQLLIDLDVVKPETNPCVLRFEEPLLFTPQILAEVPRVLQESEVDPDAKVRVDLESQAVLTIDAVTATEIDDAVGLFLDEQGREWVHVHVADVARLIPPKSLLESYAARRAVSVFLPETHFPMLPHGISNVLSLLPGRSNFAMTFAARLDKDGCIQEKRIFNSVLGNVSKISYRSADGILGSGPRPDIVLSVEHEKTLLRLKEIANQRRIMRESRGAVTMQLPEPEVRVQGKKVQVFKTERSSISRSLIEEMMILGGEIAASFAQENDIPIPYRVQHALKANIKHKTNGDPLLVALLEMERHPPAFMDVLPGRHHSLGMKAYTQVTSPIRRYSDLMVANQIKAHLRGDSLPFSSWDILRYRDHHETTVRRVDALQQNSVRYWMLKHMSSDEFRNSRLAREGLKALVLGRPNTSSGNNGIIRTSNVYEGGDLVSVFLVDMLIRSVFKLAPGQKLKEGEMIVLKVGRIDPMRLTVDFELV